MQPLAVDFPPLDVDCNVFILNGPTQDFGSGLLDGCTVPSGYSPEVVSQPSLGTVEFFDGGTGWRYTLTGSAPSVNTPDQFTFRLTNGTEHSNVATCTPLLTVES